MTSYFLPRHQLEDVHPPKQKFVEWTKVRAILDARRRFLGVHEGGWMAPRAPPASKGASANASATPQRRLGFGSGSKNQTHMNSSPHMSCEAYYDEAAVRSVLKRDYPIFEKFKYTCCGNIKWHGRNSTVLIGK